MHLPHTHMYKTAQEAVRKLALKKLMPLRNPPIWKLRQKQTYNFSFRHE